ncbi:helix-turn-helix domain-containing protein [Bradyrhizobium lablabi]|uniref:helix-turn-helix domain-containing protein n=1 Tax=Bradyrhizobium lablabi TaxID=722472 RepID=UPI0032DEA400
MFKDVQAAPGIKMKPVCRKPNGRIFPLGAASDVPLHSLSFDEYSETVIGATVNFLLTGPSQAPWSVGHCKLGAIVLQFGVEGGSKILHGISRSDALTFIFQDEKIADRVIFDGQILQPQDFVVLPPGSDFTFASRGIHRWMSISMPVGLFETFAIETGRKHLAWVEKEKCVISSPEQLLRCLSAAAASTAVLIREEQTPTLHGFSIARLLNALIAAIADLDNEMCLPTEKSRLSSDTVTKALRYARGRKWEGLQVADLALAADVTSRTLLRTFRQQLGVGPASYLKLRQLNMVRRALRGKCESSGKVTNIMSEHGVTEFGRFASEYKALFGERPSETVARSRSQRVG